MGGGGRGSIIKQVDAMELDDLDKRIIGALQVDGRASWRRIAEALGEPFRTVTRRGMALLESGAVRVAGMSNLGATHLLEVDCEPHKLTSVADKLAASPDAIFVYALTNPTRLLMETHASADLATLVLDELPALDGVSQVNASPVLEYFRTVAAWQPGLIGGQEALAIRPAHPPVESLSTAQPDDVDLKLIGSLVSDGRAPVSELAEQVGLSIPSVRRRLNTLFDGGVVSVRAIVEPANVGLPVEAILWVRVAPSEVREVGRLVAEAPGVRYAVMVMGEYQIMVNVNTRTLQELRSFLTGSDWVTRALAIRSSTVVRAFKRGGVQLPPLNLATFVNAEP